MSSRASAATESRAQVREVAVRSKARSEGSADLSQRSALQSPPELACQKPASRSLLSVRVFMLPPNSLPGESYCFVRCFLEEQRRQQHISRSAAHPAAAGNARPGTLRAGLCECVHKCRRRQHHGCCVERKGRSWKHAHTHPHTQRVCKHFVKKRRRECERRASIDAELQIAFSLRSPFLHYFSLSHTQSCLRVSSFS